MEIIISGKSTDIGICENNNNLSFNDKYVSFKSKVELPLIEENGFYLKYGKNFFYYKYNEVSIDGETEEGIIAYTFSIIECIEL